MFPHHLYSTEPTEDSAMLIRELFVHLWGRARTAAARLLGRLPQTDRDSLMRYPF